LSKNGENAINFLQEMGKIKKITRYLFFHIPRKFLNIAESGCILAIGLRKYLRGIITNE
jgi:hypothetical protein